MHTPHRRRDHWWNEASDVHEALFGTVSFLDKNQGQASDMNLHHLRLYSNRLAQGMSSRRYSVVGDGEKLKLNVIRSVIDAATAHIATNRPRPEFITIGGDYKLRKQAENLSKFVQGQFYGLDQYALSRDIFRDACIFGTGCQKIFVTPDNRIGTERVLVSELIIDDHEALMGQPRSLYQHKELLREVAISTWPEKKKEIEEASLVRDDGYSYDGGQADLISCIEAWHLPPVPGGKGRHVIAFSNCTILDEEWDMGFPFAFFRWERSPLGFWGSGVAEELSSIQVEINVVAQKIQEHFNLSAGQLWVKKGSGIAKQALNNEAWSVNTFRDAPPTHLTPPPINPMFLTYLDGLYRRAFQQVGLSEMMATSIKPAGLNSGEALRTYNDIGSKRFQHVGLNWERFHMQVADRVIECARSITKAGKGSLKVLAEGDRSVEEIDFRDVSIERNKYTMRIQPISFLSGTAAGRIAALRDLAAISPEIQQHSLELLGIPDVENIRSLLNAPIKIVDMFVDGILEDGVYRAPDPMMNLEIARQRGTLALLRAETDDTPFERVELLRKWLVDVDSLQAASQLPPQGMPLPGHSAGVGQEQQPQMQEMKQPTGELPPVLEQELEQIV
jgi:hypothetical protein